VPVSTGEAAVYLKRLVSVASGSSTVPEFTGQIEVAVGHLSCSGSGISVTPEDALIHELSMQFGNAGRMAAVISSAPLLSVEVQRDVLRCDVEE
jgi:hypothetical protein